MNPVRSRDRSRFGFLGDKYFETVTKSLSYCNRLISAMASSVLLGGYCPYTPSSSFLASLEIRRFRDEEGFCNRLYKLTNLIKYSK